MMILVLASMVFFAATMQTLSGFGFALIVMPLITLNVGYQTSAPLVALVALTLNAINVIRHRPAIKLGELFRLGIASVLGVPVGVLALNRVEESTVRLLLGLIVLTFAGYSLIRPAMPRIRAQAWAYPAGFIAGCLGGAYNVPGPPAIVYGTLRQWSKDEFRAILQALFLLNAVLVVLTHAVTNHVTTPIIILYLQVLPALLLGILMGNWLDTKLNYERFRAIVTVMLLGLGVSLILG